MTRELDSYRNLSDEWTSWKHVRGVCAQLAEAILAVEGERPTVSFRNVSASPADPVAEWPTEAVQVALERGGLPEWRRIADEIGRAPWGRAARQVEEV